MMESIQKKYDVFLYSPAKYTFIFAYILLPFHHNLSIFLVIISSTILVSRLLNRKQICFLTVLFLTLYIYIFVGSNEFRPKSRDLIQIISHFVSALVIIFPLFFIHYEVAKSAIRNFCFSVVVFVFIEGIQTLIYHPIIAAQRFMIDFSTGIQVHSTGQTNAMALATGFLLLLSGRTKLGLFSLFPLSIIALTYANRTGMILTVVFILIIFLKSIRNVKASYAVPGIFSSIIFLVGLIYFLPSSIADLLSFGVIRLSSEGLETERTDLTNRGISQILSLNHPFGGGQLEYWRDYPWYHNIFLDSYRVAGFPLLLLLLVLTLISLSAIIEVKSKKMSFVWLITLLLMITSVPIEGSFTEYTIILTMLSYPLIVPKEVWT